MRVYYTHIEATIFAQYICKVCPRATLHICADFLTCSFKEKYDTIELQNGYIGGL